MKRSRKLILLLGLPLLLIAGVAMAVWSIQGTGTGSAKAGTAGTLTVAPGTATADLYPGFTHGKVFVTVTNDNGYPVQLTNATFGAGSVTPTECLVSVNAGPFNLSSVPVIAAHTTASVTIADALSMGAAAPDSCQNNDISVPAVTIHGQTAP